MKIDAIRTLDINEEIKDLDNPDKKLDDFDSKFSNKGYLPLSISKFQELKHISESIFNLTNQVLSEIIQQKLSAPWIEERYGIVKNLWKDGKLGVNLMRIDFAWDSNDNFKILELNTASQGGWTTASLADEVKLSNKKIITLAPNPLFYVNYLLKKLGKKIVFIVTRKDYNKDLDLISKMIRDLGGEAKIICLSKSIVEDINKFSPTGLFIKSPSVLVEKAELITEITKLNLPQIHSFESIFISGDKSFLEILSDRDITNSIPKTFALSKTDLAKNLNLIKREFAVLKPSELARGEGIVFGKYFTDEEWVEKIKLTMNLDNLWILQELCYLQKSWDDKYQDIVVFLTDGSVKGIASRVSQEEIVNVANGGRAQFVVLEKDVDIKEEEVFQLEIKTENQLMNKFYFD